MILTATPAQDWATFTIPGVITTVADTGAQAYGGDGGLATEAQLLYPISVAFDVDGNLYIGDSINNRVRKIWW